MAIKKSPKHLSERRENAAFFARGGGEKARERAPIFCPMKKVKSMNEKEFLALLQKVLPQATQNPRLADEIYEKIVKEVQLRNHVQSFENFCKEGSIPDLEPATVADFQTQLATNFGESNVTVAPDEEGKAVEVEIHLPERTLSNKIKVIPPEEVVEETKLPFVPFPVSLPEDPELVWFLSRREDFAASEAARALAAIEEEFWATKAGQKLLKEVGERTFADFIAYVPAAALADSNLKRLNKAPAPRTTLRLLPAAPAESAEPAESEMAGEE